MVRAFMPEEGTTMDIYLTFEFFFVRMVGHEALFAALHSFGEYDL